MRIIRIHIENFGKLHDFDMEFQPGLNRIRAANGWGKSTLAAFLKAMFYGLEATTRRSLKENERKRYRPWQGGAFGGSLEFSAGECRYRAERFFGTKEREDTFRLYDLDTGLPSSDYTARLGEELFRLDRAAYERSSYFAQQDFSVSVNDSLNARLTRVEEDAGDMQNYEKASASLESRMKHYRKTGNRGRIPELQERRRTLLEELERCRSREAELAEQKEEIGRKMSEAESLTDRIRSLEIRIREESGRQALAARRERLEELSREADRRRDALRRTEEQLEAFDPAPPEEEELDWCQSRITRLQEMNRRIREEDGREKELGRQLEELRESGHGDRGSTAILLWAAAGILTAAGIIVMIAGPLLPGLLLSLAGAVLLLAAAFRMNREKAKKKALGRRLHELREQQTSALEACRALREQAAREQKEIGELLTAEPFGAAYDEHTLQEALQNERKRSRRYAELLRDYETQKREARDSREAMERFSAELSLEEQKQDLALLEEQLQGCEEQRDLLRERIAGMQNRVRMLSEEAERIPELEEETERLEAELREAEQEHRLLETTLQYLKEARDRFSARYLERLQQSLLFYQEQLNPGESRQPVLDVKLQVKIPEGGAVRELEYFSAGEQDLIRIAERFAVVDALYEEEQPVLILDDPFVNLDTEKYERAERFLEEQSGKRQVICFSCR